ncbi:hypothetical protein ZOD2009_14361 [Haladaptatus paucihalophilus DX253]|uniref:Uncharacterized protein n=1 Tax=Haladaptatus paucihalophilus DX253 TaxID=797209 RepID=E7QVN6_HALPU|nr:hypothetical protein [Haladaptatus paucihalophilus]EFW91299.1 hypothetical protein ZOD2009_14361 [Haladaptatus paucihalophilus DX253]SHL10075.1 hypothetical protein SAMN05444342_3023 [Haladaptatus paucihalophilus DX253]
MNDIGTIPTRSPMVPSEERNRRPTDPLDESNDRDGFEIRPSDR